MVAASPSKVLPPLLVGSGCAGPSPSLDGFPIRRGTNKLPTDGVSLNSWSNWTTKKIPIQDFWFNIRKVTWKGETIEVEYDLFKGLVEQMMQGDMTVLPKHRKRHKKEEVLDLIFEMSRG